ncbi:MAG: hypothetical protein IJ741_07115 [Schwartzia sp.]|nr:hypothetical protein [Schwartzia sp. (in: firmicutes)]
MTTWCLENPWLTFLLLLIAADAVTTRFSWNRKKELLQKDMRIRELEEILCPCEQHDWIAARYETDSDGKATRIMMCRRCKKEKETEGV